MSQDSASRYLSAQRAGLTACSHCGTLSPAVAEGEHARCPRCHAPLHPRKTASLTRTWALLLASIILYIPANVLPVMKTSSLFGAQKDTIISGVVYFWTSGSQGLAALIFSVSILVPIMKVGTLGFLAASVQWNWGASRRQKAVLYRIVEFVGRWSMLDVFVVALMVGLVRFRTLAVIEAGAGAVAFGAVVVLTMLAAHSFDPRLIWDSDEKNDD